MPQVIALWFCIETNLVLPLKAVSHFFHPLPLKVIICWVNDQEGETRYRLQPDHTTFLNHKLTIVIYRKHCPKTRTYFDLEWSDICVQRKRWNAFSSSDTDNWENHKVVLRRIDPGSENMSTVFQIRMYVHVLSGNKVIRK